MPLPFSWRWLALVGVLIVLGLVAHHKTHDPGRRPRLVQETRPRRVMGTSCRLLAVDTVAAERGTRKRALERAEATLRRLESLMSSWIETSELSRLNAAPTNAPVALSIDTLRVLRAAQALHRATRGAFDITSRPLIQLWRAAGRKGELPSTEAIHRARRSSSWRAVALGKGSASKREASAQLDLGGIAKGYAIDRAIEAMISQGAPGGLVDIGGDLRVFGMPPRGQRWKIDVRDPFDSSRPAIAKLAIKAGAVCTSGNYARFVEIAGRRLSHIVDPRSGQPASEVPSVTVIAKETMLGDAWATALSVLGEAGLPLLPEGVEALLVFGPAKRARAVATTGFMAQLEGQPALPLREVAPRHR